MTERLRITESLDVDVQRLMWCCNRCGKDLISASENYKKGCLVYARDPREIHRPIIEGEYSWSPSPDWMRIVEFYCPHCQVMFEVEYLPPGHQITMDIELDVDSLREKFGSKKEV